MKLPAALLVIIGLAGCAGTNHSQAAPPGLHPEDAPTPPARC